MAVTPNLLTLPLPISFIPEILTTSVKATALHLAETAILCPQALRFSFITSTGNDTL
jgi:hypothetical protein